MTGPKILNSSSRLVATILALTAWWPAAFTQAARAEVWEQLLGAQLEDEHKCILAGTLYVREIPMADSIALSGRARCFDGREFDFSQSKPHMKFEIKACDPVYCSTEPAPNQYQT